MLVTQQPIFRKFWHAVMPVAELADGPKPFTLLGENIVVFLDANGEPAALRDRCCANGCSETTPKPISQRSS